MLYSLKRKSRGGFTFVELLIAVSILSVISLTVYSTLNNGVKIWRRINTAIPEEDYAVFSDKFGREVRNTLRFSSMRFFGNKDRIEFPSPVRFNELGMETVGKVIYAYDPSKDTLYKWRLDFSQAYTDREGDPESALKGIKSLRFGYYFYDEEKKKFIWLDEWMKEGLPLAVRVELEFDGGKGERGITKTVSVPVSG